MPNCGDAYAAHVLHHELRCDLVFGPSYKGVPLAVATASGLARLGHDVGYSFDRKEAKDHGEGGVFVGSTPQPGQRVVVVDDVITSGQSIREAVELVRRAAADVVVAGVVVAVDRQERGPTRRPHPRGLDDGRVRQKPLGGDVPVRCHPVPCQPQLSGACELPHVAE